MFQGGSDGCEPFTDVLFDKSGNIYGTTFFGGASFFGDVFKLSPNGSGGYTESILYTFTGGADGAYAFQDGKLFLDRAGNLYGTTVEGGLASGCGGIGCGTIFELSPAGTGYSEATLYTFTGGNDGGNSDVGLTQRSGKLYGVAQTGGQGFGVVFELSKAAGVWTETSIYSFAGGVDGALPVGQLSVDTAGNLLGTTLGDSVSNLYGTVYKLTSSGSAWTETVLYSFTGGSYDQGPEAGVILDKKGNLFGTTRGENSYLSGPSGEVFELSPSQSGWTLTTLHDFAGGPSDGDGLYGGLIEVGGKLYGTTRSGGTSTVDGRGGVGTVFQITP